MATIVFLSIIFACIGALLVKFKINTDFAKNILDLYGMPFFGVVFDVYGLDSKSKYYAYQRFNYSII